MEINLGTIVIHSKRSDTYIDLDIGRNDSWISHDDEKSSKYILHSIIKSTVKNLIQVNSIIDEIEHKFSLATYQLNIHQSDDLYIQQLIITVSNNTDRYINGKDYIDFIVNLFDNNRIMFNAYGSYIYTEDLEPLLNLNIIKTFMKPY